ncbi:hypothetical protein [Haloferula sp. A504]|uniref:hypothetical protein n=1 Tax=Haloferula sp. A504 TaxID=3373601 RepID=UPI0031BDA112|nr:hypothetical protein [Verrucomicrobiaceae bacterium E54]
MEDAALDHPARTGARLRKAFLVAAGAYTMPFLTLLVRALVVNTDWRDAVADLHGHYLLLLLSGFLFPFALVLHGSGYGIIRIAAPVCRNRAWWMGGFLPLLVGLSVLVVPAIMDRISPQRYFHRVTGHELPPSAEVLAHERYSIIVEDEFRLEFVAPVEEVRAFMRAFGFKSAQDSGIECFDSVPVQGNHGSLEVDWDRGEVVFEYFDA